MFALNCVFATVIDKRFLGFKVVEYATDAYKADLSVTKLSVIAFNTAKTMSAANCTFNWTAVAITDDGTTTVKNEAFTYVSYCHENTIDYTYKKGSEAAVVKASTAKFSEFLLFDAVNIYYNDTLYYSINATNAASVGFTPSTFFAGTSSTDYTWNTATQFDFVSNILQDKDKCFSTVKAKLYIAKFQGDYSYLSATVIDKTGAKACTLVFTSLNEAVCKLDVGTGASTTVDGDAYYLVLKNAAGNNVFKQGFYRYFFTIGAGTTASQITNANRTVERQVIQWTLPPAPPATDSKSNPVMTTTFVINLKDNSTKSAPNMDDVSCPLVNVLIQSNGSTIINGTNAAIGAPAGFGYCYLTVTSNTNALVPWTDFIMNATYPVNGSTYISTKAKLTPRMISDWAANSVNGSAFVIALSDINKSGLTGGEVAAIVIGSCAGALLVALLAGIFIRWCAYGCMYPAAVAAPKMMM